MSLTELADNSRTDKNTCHSYLPLYQTLLESKKDTARNILEVGICNGGSIKLWHDFFVNASIHAIDIQSLGDLWNELKNKDRIKLYTERSAYTEKTTDLFKNIKFDFLLDDGPHTLDSQKDFIRLYSPLLAEGGLLIIEDVQSLDWLDVLESVTPDHLKPYIKTYDLRKNKGRWDDIVFTINLNQIQPEPGLRSPDPSLSSCLSGHVAVHQ